MKKILALAIALLAVGISAVSAQSGGTVTRTSIGKTIEGRKIVAQSGIASWIYDVYDFKAGQAYYAEKTTYYFCDDREEYDEYKADYTKPDRQEPRDVALGFGREEVIEQYAKDFILVYKVAIISAPPAQYANEFTFNGVLQGCERSKAKIVR
jgi:hypothetical protein